MTESPPTTQEKLRLRSFGDLWHLAITRYRNEFAVLISLAFLAQSGQLVADLWAFWGGTNASFWLIGMFLSIITVVLSVWAGLALYTKAVHAEIGTIGEAFSRGGPFFWPALGTGILVGLITLGGFFLLIIPGIYWSVLYGYAIIVVYREKVSGTSALRRSKDLVKGHWWDVWWRELLLGLIFGGLFLVLAYPVVLMSKVAGNLLQDILIALVTPIGLLFQVALYENLVALQPRPPVVPSPSPAA